MVSCTACTIIIIFPQTQCQCDEVEFLPLTLYETAVTLLQERDSCWVGQAVVARMDSDGIYYPGQPQLINLGKCNEFIIVFSCGGRPASWTALPTEME